MAARFWSNRARTASSKSSSNLGDMDLRKRPSFGTAFLCRSILWRRPNSEPAAGTHKPHDQQQHDGTDRGIDNLRYEARSQMNSKLGKQIARHQRAGDTDEDIADDSE